MAIADPGVTLGSKPGFFDRIRRALGGSPSDGQHGQVDQTAAPSYQQQLEMVRDTARDLCADTWLANQIALEVKSENGRSIVRYLPAESMPYVKAAYAIKKAELSAETQGMLEGVAA